MALLSTKTSAEETKRKESFGETFRTLFYAVLLAMVFRSLLFEPFHIPSGSMLNTLEVGDYIFVSKYSYGYSKYSFPFGLPLFEGRLADRAPERGDVAVFRLPTDDKIDYIKRIIGLPGDLIRVYDGTVFINGEALPAKQLGHYAMKVADTERRIRVYEETLPSGRSYKVLDETGFGDVDFTDEYVVPEGHYFVMGDNRDNSVDSRYQEQVGFVPEENLIGRAEIILFSIDRDVNFAFWEFWNYGEMFRPDRFWLKIEDA